MSLSLRTFLGRARSNRYASRRRARLIAAVEGLESRELLTIGVTNHPLANVDPGSFTNAPDSKIWIGTYNAIGSFDPQNPTNVIANYQLPSNESNPTSLVSGADGRIWFVYSDQTNTTSPFGIGSFDIHSHQFASYPLPGGPASRSNLSFLAFDNTGSLVEIDSAHGQISKLNTTTGSLKTVSIPGLTAVTAVAQGPGGAIWFSETGTGSNPARLYSLDTTANQITQHAISGDNVSSLTFGPDGNVWYVQTPADYLKPSNLGVINPTTGAVRNYPLTFTADSIARGYGMTLTVAERSYLGSLVVVDAGSGQFTPLHIENGSASEFFAQGPDGNTWFLNSNSIAPYSNVLSKISPKADPLISVTSSSEPSVPGAPTVTITATVAPASGTHVPTGKVRFINQTAVDAAVQAGKSADNVGILGEAVLTPLGTATIHVTLPSGSNIQVVAQYLGDDTFGQMNAAPATVTTPALVATSGAFASDLYVVSVGQPFELIDTVSSVDGRVPTGTVTFMDGNQVLGIATLDARGIARLIDYALPTLATQAVAGHYNGDNVFAPSDSNAILVTNNRVVSSIALTSNATGSSSNQPVVFTATLVDSAGKPIVNGEIQFVDTVSGATVGGNSVFTNANGQATYTIDPRTQASLPSTHQILAKYLPDLKMISSVSQPLSVTLIGTGTPPVAQAPFTVTAVANQTSLYVGQQATLTATVKAANSPATFPGYANLVTATGVIGTSLVNSSGLATFSYPGSSIGTQSVWIVYVYVDQAQNTTIYQSNAISLTTSEVPSTTTLLIDRSTAELGQPARFTANVVDASGKPMTSGFVVFFDSSAPNSATAVLDSAQVYNGVATAVNEKLGVGSHQITAVYESRLYSQGGGYINVSKPASLTVTPATTQIALTQQINVDAPSDTVPLHYTLAANQVSNTVTTNMTGTITIYDGGKLVSTQTVPDSDTSLDNLSVGTHTFVVKYSGDSNYLPSVSNTLTVTVYPKPVYSVSQAPISALAGGANVNSLIVGPDRNVWFGDIAHSTLGMFNPVTQSSYVYSVPFVPSGQSDITADSNGNLWYVGADTSGTPTLASFNVTSHQFASYSLSAYFGTTANTVSIFANTDNKIWMLSPQGKIIRFDTTTTTLTDASPFSNINPPVSPFSYTGMILGTGGTVWLLATGTGYEGSSLTQFNPRDPSRSNSFSVSGDRAYDLVLGPDGNPWFLSDATQVGGLTKTAIDLGVEQATIYVPTPGTLASSLVLGPGNTLIFDQSAAGYPVGGSSTLGILSVGNGLNYSYVTAQSGAVVGIASGPDGTPYYLAKTATGYSIGTYSLAAATTTTLVESSAVSSYGQPVTFTATVNVANSTEIPTGTVAFYQDDVLLGNVTLDSNGIATFATSGLAISSGTPKITAVYLGNSYLAHSVSAPATHVVTSISTTTTLTESQAGNVYTFTAAVASQGSSSVPTGQVVFYDGLISVATVYLDANGKATWSTSNLGAGPHSITAQYTNFDGLYSGNVSNALTQSIGSISATKSTLKVSDTTMSIDSTITLQFRVVDDQGNPINSSLRLNFGFGPGSAGGDFSVPKPLGNGLYSVTFRAADAGANTFTVSINDQVIAVASPKVTVYTFPVVAEVALIYQSVLGRLPDANGQSAAGTALLAGMAPGTLAAILRTSAEFQINSIVHDYQTYLGRTPSSAEIANCMSSMAKGLTEPQVALALLNSAEFNILHPTTASFVTAAYQPLVGRAAAPSEISAVSTALSNGMSRATFMNYWFNSPEAISRRINAIYQSSLGRDDDASGLANALAAIQNKTLTYDTLASVLFNSAEFALRAKGF